MTKCKFCGAEGLVWKRTALISDWWDLMEPEGDYHECKPEDRDKEFHRVSREKAENDEATRRYREANGYL